MQICAIFNWFKKKLTKPGKGVLCCCSYYGASIQEVCGAPRTDYRSVMEGCFNEYVAIWKVVSL